MCPNFSYFFFIKSCIKDINGYIKDLRITKLPLDHTIVIDNSRIAFRFNEDNAIEIKPWLGLNKNDNELEQLMILLMGLIKETGDIRQSLKSLKQDTINHNNSDVNSLYDED